MLYMHICWFSSVVKLFFRIGSCDCNSGGLGFNPCLCILLLILLRKTLSPFVHSTWNPSHSYHSTWNPRESTRNWWGSVKYCTVKPLPTMRHTQTPLRPTRTSVCAKCNVCYLLTHSLSAFRHVPCQ